MDAGYLRGSRDTEQHRGDLNQACGSIKYYRRFIVIYTKKCSCNYRMPVEVGIPRLSLKCGVSVCTRACADNARCRAGANSNEFVSDARSRVTTNHRDYANLFRAHSSLSRVLIHTHIHTLSVFFIDASCRYR